MKELNLSISSGTDKDNSVVLTAKFDTHDEAVAFHDGLARLCGSQKKQFNTFGGSPLKLLTRGK